MSIPWDWIFVVVLFSTMSLVAFKYYQGQAEKYRDGKCNKDMDDHRGGSCH